MKICILMGGARLILEETSFPLYMTELQGKMLVEHRISYFDRLAPSEIICCHHREDERDFHVSSVLSRAASNVRSIPIRAKTAGALCTALLASPYLPAEEEIIVAAVDELLEVDPVAIVTNFQKLNFDIGLLSFPSLHPGYSYIKKTRRGNVAEVVEKKTVSQDAVASFYYFRKAEFFIEAAMNVIRKDTPINGSFYISQSINEGVLKGLRVGAEYISDQEFHSLKNQMQLNDYFIQLRNKAGI